MLKVEKLKNGHALVACEDIQQGQELLSISGKITHEASKYSIQTGMGDHTTIADDLRFTQHFCRSPNCAFDFSRAKPWTLRARRNINKGDFISYDYVTTEYKMADEFQCCCQGDECRKDVRGFYYLSDVEKREMIREGKVSPVVAQLYAVEGN